MMWRNVCGWKGLRSLVLRIEYHQRRGNKNWGLSGKDTVHIAGDEFQVLHIARAVSQKASKGPTGVETGCYGLSRTASSEWGWPELGTRNRHW